MPKKYPKLSAVLKRLLYERDIKPVDLARAVHLPPPTIHRLITGKSKRPYTSSLNPIADYFGIEVDQLLGEAPLPGDQAQSLSDEDSHSLINHSVLSIPLLPWQFLGSDENRDEFKDVPFIGTISKEGFATAMPDTSMEPFIQRNAIVIFDPYVKPTDRNCILVKLHETKAFVVRQLLIDADHQYLKPLNPDLSAFKMRLLDKKDSVIATLIEIRFNIQSKDNQGILGGLQK